MAAAAMGIALAVAVLSVALGVALAIGGKARTPWMVPVRTFALVTSVTVVVAQLLPEALSAAGLGTLLAFGAGMALPPLLERGAASRRDTVGLELGFVGLLVHKVGDGVALGTFSDPGHADSLRIGVIGGVGAHTVPVVALVVIAYAERGGIRSGLARGAALAVAAVAGVLLAGAVPADAMHEAEPWVTATVAGLLLHVVFHDWRSVPYAEANGVRRVGDLLALGAGAGIILLASHGHGHGGASHVRGRAGLALGDLLLETAPVLLLGLGLAALLQTAGLRLPTRGLRSGSSLRQALRGALVGAPLPICACGVLPLAQSLRARGAGPALVAAFVLATPQLGVETFALTVLFLGWPFAVLRLLAAILVAVAAALMLARLAGGAAIAPREETAASTARQQGGAMRRFATHFDELLHHVGPWMLVGLVAAAFLSAAVEPGSLAGFSVLGLDVVVLSMLAVPSYVCAPSAIPLAAVLLAKGVSPGAILAGLIIGPATSVAMAGFLRGAYGARAALVGLAGLLLAVWAIAFAFNAFGVEITPRVVDHATDAHGRLAWGAAALLGLLVLGSIWRHGLRRWLGSMAASWRGGRGAHDRHDGDHRHAHG